MGEVNQKSLVAILRATLDVNPSGTVEGTEFVLAVMDYLKRTGMDVKYEAEVKVMKKHFEKALMKSHLAFVDNDLTPREWYDRH
eukprot:3009642-Pyramimonas_sp.AAC.1